MYDTPSDTTHYADATHYADPIYSSISNPYERDPGGATRAGVVSSEPQYEPLNTGGGGSTADHHHQNPFSDPQYVDADELSELYDDEIDGNTYVEGVPLPVVRPTSMPPPVDVIPNR